MPAGITHLIINSPYREPAQHWQYHRETRTFSLESGRRPAGYVIASDSSRSFDDPGRFIPIDLVNQIRPRVQAWREAGYAGTTGITKRLLEHWNDPEQRDDRFFFCQLEAIETLIWLTEAPPAERVGIAIPSDGGAFQRLCCKMATGSGKTLIMSMLIAWQCLNKVAYPQDTRYAKNFFIVAPGLTVKSRLQVLIPAGHDNYFEHFNIVPTALREQLRQGKVIIRNWHALHWDSEQKIRNKKGVDKRGAKSDEAYVRDVLGEMAASHNMVVINDEAHHAWRVPAESKVKGIKKEDIEEATKWIGGLDRIHKARGILTCFDFSATPFAPSGKQSHEEALFGWIVSDFGLNDAIEAGLVKTPRVVVRDGGMPDVKTYKSKLYHIYQHVSADLSRKGAQEHEPLPDLVMNAYLLLGKDWLAARQKWRKAGHTVPPVMITVANRTETAARVKYSFDKKKILIDELCAPERTLHIDSKVLELAEAREEEADSQVENVSESEENGENKRKLTKAEQAELLRLTVDTVGRPGQPGEQVQNVISVGMLSEGWDAKTVTHIMGLRAFSSQLLCEQVVGRGLRRTSYSDFDDQGLFRPEYVNIFGVPFTFLPHEGGDDTPPPPPTPKTRIEAVKGKEDYAVSWPNVIRIDHVYRPRLDLNWDTVPVLTLNAADKIGNAEMAAVLAGKPHLAVMSDIDLQALAERFRLQRIIFEVARDVFEQMRPTWKGAKENLLAQVIRLVERFIASPKLRINPPLFYDDELKRRIMLMLNMRRIVQHVFEQIRFANTETLALVFDGNKPIRSTGDMVPWYTGKRCAQADRSHINFCVADSTWEAKAAYDLDHTPAVEAWVKNDHLGFEVIYIFEGVIHKYRPDLLIRMANGTYLILEIKGEDTPKDQTKQRYLAEWIDALNIDGRFGRWQSAACRDPSSLPEIIAEALI